MARSRATALALLAMVVMAAALPPHAAPPRVRRQLPSEDTLQPLESDAASSDNEQVREKRKLEGVTQVKFGVKNAVLGFVFGKINKAIDAKTRLLDKLDRTNVAKNKAYNIQPPPSAIASITGLLPSIIGPKLAILGPKLSTLTTGLGGASGGSGGGGGGASAGASISASAGGGGSGGGLGSILSLVTSLSGSSSSGGSGGSGGGGGGGGGGGSAGGIGSLLSLVTSLVGSSSGGGGIINAGAAGGVDTIDSSEEDED